MARARHVSQGMVDVLLVGRAPVGRRRSRAAAGFHGLTRLLCAARIAARAWTRVCGGGDAAGPASARRDRPWPVAAALRGQSVDRGPDGALRRRALRSRWRRAGRLPDPGWRGSVGAARLDRRTMGQPPIAILLRVWPLG